MFFEKIIYILLKAYLRSISIRYLLNKLVKYFEDLGIGENHG
jgi:hypothetical protein